MAYNKEAYKRYYDKNKEKILERKREYKKEWYQKNKDRLLPKLVAYSKEWRINNPDKHAAKQGKRRAAKLQATPNWLSKQQLNDILLEYSLAKWCTEVTGIQYDVDHIVPLKGKTVCGLHVPWNLQVIQGSENRSKGNKHEWI